MEHLNKNYLLCVVVLALAGCGVKGRPLPPLQPPPLGTGEPTYKDSTTKPPVPVKKSLQDPDDEKNRPESR